MPIFLIICFSVPLSVLKGHFVQKEFQSWGRLGTSVDSNCALQSDYCHRGFLKPSNWANVLGFIRLKGSSQWKTPLVALIKALADLESNPSLWLGIYRCFFHVFIYLSTLSSFLSRGTWCQWENSLSFSGLQLCFDGAIHPSLIRSLAVTASWISSTPGRLMLLLHLKGISILRVSRGIGVRQRMKEQICLQHSSKII